ncbi:MAG: hypothetical protein ACFE8U_04265 [Candidatus Hermodarchaeota archaeon]
MKNYAICFGYVPTLKYTGFSNQLHDSNNIFTLVVNALKNARLIDLKSSSNIRYASRTDRGVGALHQVVTFNSERIPILSEINSHLPEAIQALAVANVSSNFHPRRDAILRTYSYFLSTTKEFDLSVAQKTLAILKGTHNFRNFAKIDPTKKKNTTKDIVISEIFPIDESIYQIRIASKSFLWKQIRRIVGHLIEVSTGKHDSQHTFYLLESDNNPKNPPSAPPEYLVLEHIQFKGVHFEYDKKSSQSFQNILVENLVKAQTNSVLYSFFIQYLKKKV